MPFIDDALNIASAALGFLGSSGGAGGSSPKPAKGLAGITAFVNQVLSGLEQLKAQVNQLSQTQRRSMAAQISSNVSALVAALSDPAQVYQAQRGDDAAALTRGKTQATAIAQEIQSLLVAAPITANGVTTAGNNLIANSDSGVATQGSGQLIQGVDNNILLIGGVAVAAFLLLRKK